MYTLNHRDQPVAWEDSPVGEERFSIAGYSKDARAHLAIAVVGAYSSQRVEPLAMPPAGNLFRSYFSVICGDLSPHDDRQSIANAGL